MNFIADIHHSMHAHLNSFRHLVKQLTNGMYSIFITFNFVLYLYGNLTKSLHRFNGKTIQRVGVRSIHLVKTKFKLVWSILIVCCLFRNGQFDDV